jgi:hypothetical protein
MHIFVRILVLAQDEYMARFVLDNTHVPHEVFLKQQGKKEEQDGHQETEASPQTAVTCVQVMPSILAVTLRVR